MLAGRAGPALVGTCDVDGAVGGLDDGRRTDVTEPREQHVDGDGADQHRRREPAQAQPGGLRVVQQLGQRGLVVGAEVGLGVADPDRAERPRGVVDEVRQRLRHGRPRDRGQELVQLGGGPPDVERPPDRGRGEAVDGATAARLDLGDQLEPPGQGRLQRPGRDGGQVGLEQHVVDRLGQQGRQRLDRLRVVVGEQQPGVRRQPVEPGDAERGGLPDRPEHLLGPQPRSPRALPAEQRDDGRRPGPGREHLAAAEGGQSAASVIRRVSGMCTAASSGASAFHVLPAGSRCPTSPGIRGLSSQTRTSATQRSAVGRSTQASNRSVGSHTGLPFAVGHGGDQPGRRRGLDEQRHGRLVEVQGGGRRLEVAHAEAAAAQSRRRGGAPEVEQQLDPPYGLERRPGRRPVDQGLRPAARWPGPGRRRPARPSSGRRAGRLPPRRGPRAVVPRGGPAAVGRAAPRPATRRRRAAP